MYAAITKNGQLWYAKDAQGVQDREWFCPKCRQPVQLIIRRHGCPYFRHKISSKTQHIGESYIHTETKKQLANYYRQQGYDIEMEYHLIAIDRIADILLTKKRLIIEVQHTPISVPNIKQRTKSYHKIGYHCLWLLTPSIYNLSDNHYWQYALLQFHSQLGYYRLVYNPEIKKVILQWNFELVNVKKINYYEFHGDPNILVNIVPRFVHENSRRVSLKLGSKNRDDVKRIASLRKNYTNSDLLQALYQEGYTLNSLPQWIFTEYIHLRGLNTPPWKVLSWVWLQSNLETSALKDILLQLINDNRISKYEMPFVSTNQWLKDLANEIELLFNKFEQK